MTSPRWHPHAGSLAPTDEVLTRHLRHLRRVRDERADRRRRERRRGAEGAREEEGEAAVGARAGEEDGDEEDGGAETTRCHR